MKTQREKSVRRAQRNRIRLRKLANGRPRLSVFRSSKNISAQIIDDVAGKTIVSASSLEEVARKEHSKGCDVTAAALVGKLIAERAAKEGVKTVVFDRGGYIYHGRVKALAEAAREGGLDF
ncbi:MAG: 50S ribosomal protein L18 [Maricaulis sp.]|jgi:large subunit ribosomal protein L18|uniref:50S ribosomal protein L18 n=1 Tax=Maricaulis sp. TaxID=1486257 RepID=UPI001B14B879|nr:50S ribosomal protein L18 [Maricaulis sp.]MBO6728258.1 50S ribosomal protein L18 [Maricaulis sp.]MBO6848756.1 50S ribosomal protein L18 [Maricaulis sp.]MBO6876575.1 50S ribosomal protein L18 [Maricaulis sp.]